MLAALEQVLLHRPEDALELRRAPPARAWLAACQRCRGPEILFAFFEGVGRGPAPNNKYLTALLRKFRSHGSQRITLGNSVLVIVDDDDPTPQPNADFIYLDRRRHKGPVVIPHRIARHVICEHGQTIDGREEIHYENVLTSVWLPAATAVGPHAFEMRSTLTYVSLPEIQSIGKWAFRECICLRFVSLSAREVGVGAFIGCVRLQAAILPLARDAAANLFWECRNLYRLSMPAATRVCYGAFRNCGSLEYVEFPAACWIEHRAFLNCTSLWNVALPSAKSIEGSAFDGCPNLKQRPASSDDSPDTLIAS